MTTIYKFNDQVYHNFADLCNAYFQVKGYFPTVPVSIDHKNNVVQY